MWCPKVNRLEALAYPRKRAAFLSILAIAAVLAVPVVALAIYGAINLLYIKTDTSPWTELLVIEYVAANQTSRDVFCQLRNSGTLGAILTEVRVNGSLVATRDLMPIPFPPTNVRYTYVFRYDGPWQGSILITLHTASGRSYPYMEARRTPGSENPESPLPLVDLQAASERPIERAFVGSSTREELRLSFLEYTIIYNATGPPYSRLAALESPDAKHLLSQAGSKLAEAQDAYSRRDLDSAFQLAVSALGLKYQAVAAEENYQNAKSTSTYEKVYAVGTIAIILISLVLLWRKGRLRVTGTR